MRREPPRRLPLLLVGPDFLRDVLILCHPDLHDKSRRERAERVCKLVTEALHDEPESA